MTDTGLKELAPLKNLVELNLSFEQGTDAGSGNSCPSRTSAFRLTLLPGVTAGIHLWMNSDHTKREQYEGSQS